MDGNPTVEPWDPSAKKVISQWSNGREVRGSYFAYQQDIFQAFGAEH